MSVALKYVTLLTACCACLAFGQTPSAKSTDTKSTGSEKATITDVTPSTENVQMFGQLELRLDAAKPADPYDPALAPSVQLTSPTGETSAVAAFWFQDFAAATLLPRGEPHYRARFTPTQTGVWRATFAGETLTFEVTEGDNPGFLRVSKTNPRYLAFDDGTPYFGIGLNIAWAESVETTLADYERWFDALAAQGGNLARLWFAPWGFALEWNDTGLGDYSQRLDRAWLFDRVLELAEARGIYLILVLTNHGQFSESTNPEWADNPYNAANGGPCDDPECFATDRTAKAFFKKRLAYIAARYAYSPNILAWEWWNEVNFTPIAPADLEVWLDEMNTHLGAVDPHRHLTTNSYGSSSSGDLWNSPAVDLTQFHLYDTLDPCLTFPGSLERMASQADQPVLQGEFGFGTGGEDPDGPDRDGIHLHNALWASALSGYANTAMYWWWDSYVEPLGLWRHFGSLSRFLEGENLAGLEPSRVAQKSPELCVLSRQAADRALVWVRQQGYTAQAAHDAYTEVLRSGTLPAADWRYEAEPVRNTAFTLVGLSDGLYTLRPYDPQTGVYLAAEQVKVRGGRVSIPVPLLGRDLAFKLRKH